MKNEDKKPNSLSHIREIYKDLYALEGYQLVEISPVQIVFFRGKKGIYVEKAMDCDRLSSILLRLIQLGMDEEKVILEYLGMEPDDFPRIHFRYLLNQGLIADVDGKMYITQLGRDFLQSNSTPRQIERIDFEFYMTYWPSLDKLEYVSLQEPIDRDLDRLQGFSGYALSRSAESVKAIPHEANLSPSRIMQDFQRLIEHFHAQNPTSSFYDTTHQLPKVEKYHIHFYALYYTAEATQSLKVAIVHSEKTLKTPLPETPYRQEYKLSQLATEYFTAKPEEIKWVFGG